MLLLYHSKRKKKRPERVVEDADPCDEARRSPKKRAAEGVGPYVHCGKSLPDVVGEAFAFG